MVKPERDRLRRAFGVVRSVPGADQTPLHRALQRHGERERRRRVPVDLPEGGEAENARGRFWLRSLRYASGYRHGDHALAAGRQTDGAALARLLGRPALSELDARTCLFLDTETTGLSGGAGTTVFLTGLAYFRDEDLVLEQVFLRDFGEEPAALQHVAERLAEFPTLVTFVGKSFDRHRLAARMAVHRIAAEILTEAHLDLYHAARRLWKRELPDMRLRTVEELRLGVFRIDDLPGSEAPLAFLQWLRDRTGPVDRVLEHNRLDVLSLVTLLGLLSENASR